MSEQRMGPCDDLVRSAVVEPTFYLVDYPLWQAILPGAVFRSDAGQAINFLMGRLSGQICVRSARCAPKRTTTLADLFHHYPLLHRLALVGQPIERHQILAGEQLQIATDILQQTGQRDYVLIRVVHQPPNGEHLGREKYPLRSASVISEL